MHEHSTAPPVIQNAAKSHGCIRVVSASSFGGHGPMWIK
jgi:hypothetical protein